MVWGCEWAEASLIGGQHSRGWRRVLSRSAGSRDDYDDIRGLGACFDLEGSIDQIQGYYQSNFPQLLTTKP